MRRLAPLLFLLSTVACHDQAGGGAGPRSQIRVVGSSTVYPFTATVAEALVASDPRVAAPVIESTGTGAGFRLFCAGVGAQHPDVADASRRMTLAEYRRCAANGAGDLLEIPVGIDGIAVAQSRAANPLSLTITALYRALAARPLGADNKTRTWADVNPRLPAVPIQVYGPPATSGTRDAFADLILARGCDGVDPAAAALASRDPAAHRARCTRVREDGAYLDAGENDNLIVRKLQANPQAIGVFGYAYLDENAGAVRPVPLNGVLPGQAAIADGRYPGSRPLYLYAKRAHLDAVPGLRRFLSLYVRAAAPDGPLVRRGLIAAPTEVRARAARIVAHEVPLDPRSLS